MRGIKYGYFHTYTAWGLYLQKYHVGKPVPRRHKVTIPGAHGALDTSKALTGTILYDNRTITASFVMMGDREDWAANYSTILAAIHGQEMKVIIDDDPDYYYMGFVEVGDLEPGDSTASLTITVDAYPYKYEVNGEGVKL